MRDFPIIYSDAMVRALLDGRKAMTRRLAWHRGDGSEAVLSTEDRPAARPTLWQDVKPGDRLWVRENWKPHSIYADRKPRDIPVSNVFYRADGGYAPSNSPWIPSIHMTRWASRLTLSVTAVRREPIQAITDDDATTEGCFFDRMADCWAADTEQPLRRKTGATSARGAFYCLWIYLHGEQAWAANPDVMAISFTVHRCNIDALEIANG